MEKLNQLLTGRLKKALSLMSLMIIIMLFASIQFRSWGSNKSVISMGGLALVGLVVKMKEKKEGEAKSAWDVASAETKAFAEGLDAYLKDFATSAITKEALDARLKEYETEAAKKTAGMTPEEKKSYDDTVESAKKMAQEFQKMKDLGFEAREFGDFTSSFIKGFNEKKEEILAIKGNRNASVNFSFKAAAAMTTGNVSANTSPQMPGTTVEMGLASAPRNIPFILDFVDNGNISTPTYMWFNKVNRQDGTAMIAEGDLKPLSDFDIVGETQSVKKVATRFNVSEETLTDIPAIETELRGEGIYNLRLAIDNQILAGDNTGNNLKGILEYAGAYTLPAIEDSTTEANEYDAILAVNTMLDTLNFQASAVFVHPVTRFKLRTIKDKNGNYIIPPSADKNALNIDGLPVIAKNQITIGDFLIGDMKKSHVKFLMDINVRVGYDGDDFSHNRVTFLVEARLLHYIKEVETAAFVSDSFAVVKAALEAPGL